MADYPLEPRTWFTSNAVSNAAAADYTIAVGFKPAVYYFSNTGANPCNVSFTAVAVITNPSATFRILAGKDMVLNLGSPSVGNPAVDTKVSMISETGATTVVVVAVGAR